MKTTRFQSLYFADPLTTGAGGHFLQDISLFKICYNTLAPINGTAVINCLVFNLL